VSFIDDTRKALAGTPLARVAALIAEAEEEFYQAHRQACDEDGAPACTLKLVPERPEGEGGCGTGTFILQADFEDREVHDLEQLQKALAPLMRKWGVAYIEGCGYSSDCAWLGDEGE
jgi:hypothetical protein